MNTWELKELIKQKEDELFWKRLNPEAVLRGETDKLEGEIKVLKELYWEMIQR
ncbi:hypothetical protein [Thermococcus indicus]|uniref:hypothetical protein n=1 Tax=Thermococcus indicus TaxID=2586643 RepID=UPI00143D4747|nr:hypothetical protein [Thermococcus indicus]